VSSGPIVDVDSGRAEGAHYGPSANELMHPQTDPATLVSYKEVLKWPRYASNAEELSRLYPATTDSEARAAFMALGTDDGGHGAYYFARDMAQIMPNTYLFYFTYPSRGRFSGHGAVHGAELKFLAGIFRKGSEPIDEEDEDLMNTMQEYWARFAASGDPNGPDVPKWPAYDPNHDLRLEIGKVTRAVPVPHKDKYKAIDQSLRGRETELKEK
jgi:para-nitrobenzyl esterase